MISALHSPLPSNHSPRNHSPQISKSLACNYHQNAHTDDRLPEAHSGDTDARPRAARQCRYRAKSSSPEPGEAGMQLRESKRTYPLPTVSLYDCTKSTATLSRNGHEVGPQTSYDPADRSPCSPANPNRPPSPLSHCVTVRNQLPSSLGMASKLTRRRTTIQRIATEPTLSCSQDEP